MTLSKRDIGTLGEDVAVKYLKENNWEILERNFYIRGGEVDIIGVERARCSAPALVFIEVKFRTTNKFGEGVEQFTNTKRKRIKKAGLQFLQKQTDLKFTKIRYDFISIIRNPDGQLKLKHFKNV